MITKTLKAKWLKALRSGDYVQGYGSLKNTFGNKFCCLGVLCDVSKKGEWKNSLYELSNGKELCGDLAGASWLTQKTQGKLMEMNDRGGKSFKEIAAWISRNVKTRKSS